MNFQYNVLDIFCGAGGMTEGFLQAGFKVPFASDYSKEAGLTYTNRHKQLGHELNFFNGDIKQLTKKAKLIDFLNGQNIDVLVGGPPCQGFSLSGKRNENDSRNELFLDYLKVLKLVNPKYFVIENVEGLLSFKFKQIKGISGTVYEDYYVSDVILNEAMKLGYSVKFKLLNAKDYGVPQFRQRVIFLGHKVKRIGKKNVNLVIPPNFPEPLDKNVTVEEAISDIRFFKKDNIDVNYDGRYKVTEYQLMLRNGLTPDVNGRPIKATKLLNHETSRHLDKTIDRFRMLKSGETIGELLKRLNAEDYEKYFTKKFRCQKLNKGSVSPTVVTLPDDIVHYDEKNPRILSVRELARLQSFDDSFEFLGNRTTGGEKRKYETPQYTQVGNAVPPLMSYAIANDIMKALEDTELLLKNVRLFNIKVRL